MTKNSGKKELWPIDIDNIESFINTNPTGKKIAESWKEFWQKIEDDGSGKGYATHDHISGLTEIIMFRIILAALDGADLYAKKREERLWFLEDERFPAISMNMHYIYKDKETGRSRRLIPDICIYSKWEEKEKGGMKESALEHGKESGAQIDLVVEIKSSIPNGFKPLREQIEAFDEIRRSTMKFGKAKYVLVIYEWDKSAKLAEKLDNLQKQKTWLKVWWLVDKKQKPFSEEVKQILTVEKCSSFRDFSGGRDFHEEDRVIFKIKENRILFYPIKTSWDKKNYRKVSIQIDKIKGLKSAYEKNKGNITHEAIRRAAEDVNNNMSKEHSLTKWAHFLKCAVDKKINSWNSLEYWYFLDSQDGNRKIKMRE